MSSLRTSRQGLGDSRRSQCCEKREETAANPRLSANMRTELNSPRVSFFNPRTGARNSLTGGSGGLTSPKSGFVTECSQKHKKQDAKRFVFSSATKLRKGANLPFNQEIPAVSV